MAETITLPIAVPAAKMTLLVIFTPKFPRVHASATLAKRSCPGQSGIGTMLTSRILWVAAISTIANGKTASSSPRNKRTWLMILKMGVRSIIAISIIMYAPLDVAELEEGDAYDDGHQNDRLRRRT